MTISIARFTPLVRLKNATGIQHLLSQREVTLLKHGNNVLVALEMTLSKETRQVSAITNYTDVEMAQHAKPTFIHDTYALTYHVLTPTQPLLHIGKDITNEGKHYLYTGYMLVHSKAYVKGEPCATVYSAPIVNHDNTKVALDHFEEFIFNHCVFTISKHVEENRHVFATFEKETGRCIDMMLRDEDNAEDFTWGVANYEDDKIITLPVEHIGNKLHTYGLYHKI
jgi:hypothetical protein